MESNSVTSISQLPTNNNFQNDTLQQNIQQNQNNIILSKNDILNEPTSQILNQNPNPKSNPNANAIPVLNQETNNVVQNNPNYNVDVLLPSPDTIVIPPPLAAASFAAPDPNSRFLSSTDTVVEFIVVVVPST